MGDGKLIAGYCEIIKKYGAEKRIKSLMKKFKGFDLVRELSKLTDKLSAAKDAEIDRKKFSVFPFNDDPEGWAMVEEEAIKHEKILQ